jgi:hypothetical protein
MSKSSIPSLKIDAGSTVSQQPSGLANKVKPNSDPVSAALQQLHDSITSEEVPDDFLRLLDAIDDKIASGNDTA